MVYHEISIMEEIKAGRATLRRSTKGTEMYQVHAEIPFNNRKIGVCVIIPALYKNRKIKIGISHYDRRDLF